MLSRPRPKQHTFHVSSGLCRAHAARDFTFMNYLSTSNPTGIDYNSEHQKISLSSPPRRSAWSRIQSHQCVSIQDPDTKLETHRPTRLESHDQTHSQHPKPFTFPAKGRRISNLQGSKTSHMPELTSLSISLSSLSIMKRRSKSIQAQAKPDEPDRQPNINTTKPPAPNS